MPEYLLAPALVTFRAQFDARFPSRRRTSDGWIGDAAHRNQGSDSDHNPWVVIDGQRYVTAFDLTHDPANGVDIDRISDELVAARDRRIKYVIANALIADSRPQFKPWTWQPSSGHTQHMHLSVMNDRSLLDGRNWSLPVLGGTTVPVVVPPSGPAPAPSRAPAWPLPAGHYFGLITGPNESHGGYYANERPHIVRIQQALQRLGYAPNYPGWADGKYEKETVQAVAWWQREKRADRTSRYGEVWSDDWAHLLG